MRQHSSIQLLRTPRAEDLALSRLSNGGGLQITLLPNGSVFAIEHVQQGHRIMVNRTLGSLIGASMGRICLRVGGSSARVLPVSGAEVRGHIGATDERFVWVGESDAIAHQVTLQLLGTENVWMWRVQASNGGKGVLACDAILIQDLGLGALGFLMNNEAYASQYLDHYIARHPRMGPILMGRQNLAQAGQHPWVAHGCLEGTVGYATDFLQLLGPAWREAAQFAIPFGTDLPSVRLQHETACAAIQSAAVALEPGATASWTFFGIYCADHPRASSDADLAVIDASAAAREAPPAPSLQLSAQPRDALLEARCATADTLSDTAVRARYPDRELIERSDGRLLSFFAARAADSRHIVLREKELRVARRHGAILVGGSRMLPDDATLCLTCWMHGVFGAQLTLGNTSFHRLWSISRDPYNITRGSGLRLLVDADDGWELLTVPSAFEIGLADCRWIYQLGARTITVAALVSGEEPAVQWRVSVEGSACRFLVFGQLVLGEQEYGQAAQLEIDTARRRFIFRPEPGSLWSQRYPRAVYQLVTSTPQIIEAIGNEALLGTMPKDGTAAYATLRTAATHELVFAVVGSLSDPDQAERLAGKYAGGVDDKAVQAQALSHWRHITRSLRIVGAEADAGARAIDAMLPWLVHDAMVHLTVPHGLEQYTGGAWGTRDVCQGPIELLLALEHDEPAKEILRVLFAQQYEQRGDWPQWFMLEPYSIIQDKEAHGDVIVWPLKALCDYIEATGDFAILDEPVPWRREDNLERTTAVAPIAAHIEKLIATIGGRFIPGTHLIRYGNGDWNDSLQPVDPAKRDSMVSSWTVALLFEQLRRYGEVQRRSGRSDGSAEERLAAAMREDFNRFLVRDGTVAGYAEFTPAGAMPELLLHPSDRQTGIGYSLLPMVQAILGALFTAEQTRHHLELIRRHLRFPDGVRLMNRPLAYHGGPQTLFQRAESAAFFGREIGLMYTHAHLRYAQAMAGLGEAQELWDALLLANPIAVTERLSQASLRQRNTYFSSSDAAFTDRYRASAEWARVAQGTIAADGGWRTYSSGPGLYVNVLITHSLGVRRAFGARILRPCLPASLRDLQLESAPGPRLGSPPR
jgi:cellobiose phosphorylase